MDAKLTVGGSEFHKFTILFATNTDAQNCCIKVYNAYIYGPSSEMNN